MIVRGLDRILVRLSGTQDVPRALSACTRSFDSGARFENTNCAPALRMTELRQLSSLAALFAFLAFALPGIGWSGWRRFFQNCEVDLFFYGIDAVDDHAELLADAVDLARVLSDNLARVFVKRVAVVDQRIERDEALDEEVGELDEESELSDAGDEAVEIFSDAVLHELHFLPFHELALGVVGAAFGMAGFFGDDVKFFERDRPGERCTGFAMGGVIASLGPGRWSVVHEG